jgi:hypothetical protein
MNGNSALESINILLSREELLFILDLLQADFIPGLEADPRGELTAEQRALALTVAGRALWARQLAQLNSNGEWLIHNDLLTIVGGCAYAQEVISVYHWPANETFPHRLFGHIRENDVVIHTRPADVLHRFTLLSSKAELITQVLALCEFEGGSASPPRQLTVPGNDFAKIQALAGAGDAAGVVDMLATTGTATEAAQAFGATLASSPRLSIMQVVKQQANGAAQKDFTLLQNGHYAWLIHAPASAAGDPLLSIKTTTRDEVIALLSE